MQTFADGIDAKFVIDTDPTKPAQKTEPKADTIRTALQTKENSNILNTIVNLVVEGFTLGCNVFVQKYFLPTLTSAPRHNLFFS